MQAPRERTSITTASNPLQDLSVPRLSNEQITLLMKTQGFPELERVWESFAGSGAQAIAVDEDRLERRIRAHSAPLFGAPKLTLAAVTAASAMITAQQHETVRSLAPCPSLEPVATAGYALNLSLLLTAGLIGLQRYIVRPLKRLMAEEAAVMLSYPDLRRNLTGSARFIHHGVTLRELGISDTWDDPAYQARYRLERGEVVAVELDVRSLHEHLRDTLRGVLGYKDEATRKFVPGRWTPLLNEGKQSVSKIVQEFASEMEQLRAATLSRDDAVRVLSDILDRYTKPNSTLARFLSDEIRQFQNPRDALPDGVIAAKVWRRDPWRDLTSQRDFYSSASLRGKSPFEAGSKGRLGCFRYIRNPSISCLDLFTTRGRGVRVRMVATLAQDVSRSERAVLFVDGVEGTNAIRPEIVHRAIKTYARACGFSTVLYNSAVHNQTPKLFVRYLEKQRLPQGEVLVAAVDSSRREYLDAFGLPLQPFEYAFPRGPVLAHQEQLDPNESISHHPPTIGGRSLRILQKTALSLLYADATLFIAMATAQISLSLTLASLSLMGVGFFLNQRYQGRAARAASKDRVIDHRS